MPVAVKSAKQSTKNTNAINVAQLKVDVRNYLDEIGRNETANVKITQEIAYKLFQYRLTEKSPVAFDVMKADNSALSTWRSTMRELFLGKRPSSKDVGAGNRSQAFLDEVALYDRRAAAFNNATLLVAALGQRGIGVEQFSTTLECFTLPPALILPMGWEGAYELAVTIDAGKLIALDNSVWWAKGLNDEGKRVERKVNASVRQVLAVYREKPKVAASSSPDAPEPLHTAKVHNEVFKEATAGRLAIALRAAFARDDRDDVASRSTDYEPKEWEAMLSLAQRIMSMANAAELIGKSEAELKSAA